jgi:uncharacterized protein YcbK (DUF882 family)
MGDISRDFSRSEFLCKCGFCTQDTVDAELLEILQVGKSITITSGNRCRTYNARVGGAINSQHTKSRAADIVVQDYGPEHIHDLLDSHYKEYISLGLYVEKGFVHLDTRTDGGKRWVI